MKKLGQRGEWVVLPIVGDTFWKMILGNCLPLLIFRDENGVESSLEVEERVLTLSRGNYEQALSRLEPQEMGLLLPHIGAQVTDAAAHKQGLLRVEFSTGWSITIHPNSTFEGWHFQCPCSGRPWPDGQTAIFLHGDDGRLIG